MDRKAFPFELVEAKAGDSGPQFTGYVSTYGNVDHVGDVVVRGAFDRSLSERAFRPLLWSHDSHLPPIGVEQSLKSDDKGLLGTWSLLDTQLGGDVYKALKSGALRRMSIGYVPIEAEYDGDVRKLLDVELLESSLVNVPANDDATVESVKAEWSTAYVNNLPDSSFAVILPGGEKDSDGRTTPRSLRKLPHHNRTGSVDRAHLNNALSREPQTDMPDELHSRAKSHLKRHQNGKDLFDSDVPFDELLAQLKGWIELSADEAEALFERRAADERKLSDAHIAAVTELLACVKATAPRFETVITPPPPEGGLSIRLELARRRVAARALETSR